MVILLFLKLSKIQCIFYFVGMVYENKEQQMNKRGMEGEQLPKNKEEPTNRYIFFGCVQNGKRWCCTVIFPQYCYENQSECQEDCHL